MGRGRGGGGGNVTFTMLFTGIFIVGHQDNWVSER